MLEQSIHDPCSILHGYSKNMLEYYHSSINEDDDLNYITFQDGKIDTVTLNVLNTDIKDGTLEEYYNMVKTL